MGWYEPTTVMGIVVTVTGTVFGSVTTYINAIECENES
jgi:hypothetical protein